MHSKLKQLLLISLIFLSASSYADQVIKGFVVYQDRTSATNVAVYINYSTTHTRTNKDGYFELNVNEGYHDLIVSSIGYETIIYKMKVAEYNSALTFILVKKQVLNFSKTESEDVWKHHLKIFNEAFIGKTAMAQGCTITNPKTLSFTFNPSKGELTAISKAPLLIENKSLGYLISYDLKEFTSSIISLSYDGYVHYKKLKGNPPQEKRWIENRELAYKGSRTHFIRSLINKNLEEQGFFVHQFNRFPNPNSPKKSEIQKARETVVKNYNYQEFDSIIKPTKKAIDSARSVLRKLSLPKYSEVVYNKKPSYNEMLLHKNNDYYIKFDGYLKIIYTREREEKRYLQSHFVKSIREAGYQITNLDLLSSSILIDSFGAITQPLNLLMEGYWAFKRIADLLPLNYPENINE